MSKYHNRYSYSEGDLVGELIYISKEPSSSSGESYGKFRCSCGNEFVTSTRSARNLISRSCGCKKSALISIKNRVHNQPEYLSNGIKRMPFLRESDVRRFWSKVNVTDDLDECWYWTSANNKRYGVFTIGKGYTYKSNRLAYFIHYKKDPEGKLVLHSCHNSMCCNPNHLSLGTQDDNMQDMVDAGRSNNQYTKNIINKLK